MDWRQMSGSGFAGLLEGFFQGLFLFVVFSDVASALISYFLVNKIVKRTAKYKALLAFGSWTALFFGCLTLVYAPFLLTEPDIPSLFIRVLWLAFFDLFGLIYIVTWILGALIVIHEKPEGY
jgi:uncharacterized membrane protein HdeD (DUF308 family)